MGVSSACAGICATVFLFYAKSMAWAMSPPWWMTGREYGTPEGIPSVAASTAGVVAVQEVYRVRNGPVAYYSGGVHADGRLESRARNAPFFMVHTSLQFGVTLYEPEPSPYERETKEWMTGLSMEELFTYRDAGRYAELLTRLHCNDTREAWVQILEVDLARAAAYRKRVRTHSSPKIRLKGDTSQPPPATADNLYLAARRAYNPELDTVAGRHNLVMACLARAAARDEAAVTELALLMECGRVARQELIERNAPLVFTTAARARNVGRLPWRERISAGYEGLERSVDTYDMQAGRFSSFAVQTIGYYMLTAARAEFSQRMNITPHLLGRIRKMNNIESALLQELRREPTVHEIAHRMGVKPRTVTLYKMYAMGVPSVQAANHPTRNLESVVAGNRHAAAEADADAAEMLSQTLHRAFAVSGITDAEMRLLYGLFGLPPYEEQLTEKELAAELRLSPSSIRQLFASAQRKLLRSSEAAQLLHAHLKKTT